MTRRGRSRFIREVSPSSYLGRTQAWREIQNLYILDAVTSSGILKAKQKLGVTFNSDKLGGIDLGNFQN